MKVLIADTVDTILTDGLKAIGYQVTEDYESSKNEVMDKLDEYEGLVIRSRFPVDKELIESGTNLKFIARVGAGMENIDIPFAESQGIHLIKAPEGNRDAVGEHAIGMILMLFNNLKRSDAEVRRGLWRREENRGLELQGKTVGIIGYGQMGSAFAEKLHGFGCKILAHDKYIFGFGNGDVKEVSLEDIQREADIVSLHVPQSEETIGMVDENFIQGFEKPFYLINTARGKSVKTQALVGALKNKKVLGACLDVLEYEKASFEDMFLSPAGGDAHRMGVENLPGPFRFLIESENVILSPHIAGWTVESNQKMAQTILDKVKSLNLI